MGLGPPVIALYYQLKQLGIFDSVKEVIELGSQNVWCPQTTMVRNLFRAFGREVPSDTILQSFADWTGSARDLYENLGLAYNCVDTDGKFGALVLDINFASVPSGHKARYDLTTNHGATEHLFNQLNAFKMIHDFTKPQGLMLHAVPFLGQLNHGFFNYQPELFDSLARYNSYRTLGVWLGIDSQLPNFVPWDRRLLDFLVLSPKSTGLLIVLHQKQYDTEFCIPFQGVYEGTMTDDVSSQYCFVIDGEYYDGRRDTFITRDQLTGGKIGPSLRGRPGRTDLSGARARELAMELAKRVSVMISSLARRRTSRG